MVEIGRWLWNSLRPGAPIVLRKKVIDLLNFVVDLKCAICIYTYIYYIYYICYKMLGLLVAWENLCHISWPQNGRPFTCFFLSLASWNLLPPNLAAAHDWHDPILRLHDPKACKRWHSRLRPGKKCRKKTNGSFISSRDYHTVVINFGIQRLHDWTSL